MNKKSGPLASATVAIERQRQELRQLIQSTSDAGNYETGREALQRWKVRTVRVLKEKVSQSEAQKFGSKHRSFFVMGDPIRDIIAEAEIYEGFLAALVHELQAHPEAIVAARAESTASVPSRHKETADPRSVFIVHGHDDAAKFEVARFLEKIGCIVTILHEQPSGGRTVIEKLEHNAAVAFVVVLLTPDDLGRDNREKGDRPRARQNVILELGYFIGKLGRGRVCALVRDEVEKPSDFAGVVWVPFDSGAWKQSLMQELKEAHVMFNAAAAFS